MAERRFAAAGLPQGLPARIDRCGDGTAAGPLKPFSMASGAAGRYNTGCMSIQTHIDPDTGFRTHTVTGDISMDDVRRTLQETYAHTDFRPEAPAMWDLTAASGDLSTEEIRHLADFVGNLVGEKAAGRVALLVSSDFEFGIARMYESILGGQSSKSIMVFRDRDEAQRWLSDVG